MDEFLWIDEREPHRSTVVWFLRGDNGRGEGLVRMFSKSTESSAESDEVTDSGWHSGWRRIQASETQILVKIHFRGNVLLREEVNFILSNPYSQVWRSTNPPVTIILIGMATRAGGRVLLPVQTYREIPLPPTAADEELMRKDWVVEPNS